jgi:hypothetical protein
MYTHCPHCAFPAVISGIDRMLMRYCRQCRRKYVPEDAMTSFRRGTTNGLGRKRAALRAQLRQRQRSIH